MLSVTNDTALRHSNWRAARPEVFDRGRGAQSSLAAPPGKDYRERVQGTEKLADMHILKVWSRYPKIVLLAVAPSQSPWTAPGAACRDQPPRSLPAPVRPGIALQDMPFPGARTGSPGHVRPTGHPSNQVVV
jgi:hypothetical protein